MTGDQLQIVLIAAAWSGGVGLVGLALVRMLRGRSLRLLSAAVATVALLAVLAAMLGTARAMFISPHDLQVMLLGSAVAGVVGVAFAVAVGAAIATSSRGLREEARRFGDSGEFGATAAGPAELRELSEELARTSRRLQESRERETRLERSRRELVSWVSHDLRTPLAGLRAMTEALEDGLAEDPARYYTQMSNEVDRMVRMVDDLFELSRIHAGVLQLTLQPVALGDLVSETLAGADPVARERRVHLGGRVEEGLELVADPGELSRALSNLLMNAIRHTPVDGTVWVEGRTVPDGVELSVLDGCGGLSEEDAVRVFDVGWRGSPARSPGSGPVGHGAGLGLAIVRGIVEAHSGEVAVRNEADGCRFRMVLPAWLGAGGAEPQKV